jgi:hypothetical protein
MAVLRTESYKPLKVQVRYMGARKPGVDSGAGRKNKPDLKLSTRKGLRNTTDRKKLGAGRCAGILLLV